MSLNLTDDTACPASSMYSGSELSLASSFDQPMRRLHFLNNSWPFLDKLDDHQYSSSDSCQYEVSRDTEPIGGSSLHFTATPSYGCNTDAHKLYHSPVNHYNPSASGLRTAHELEDYIDWANGFLQHSVRRIKIKNLTQSFADGLTLVSLVEALLGIAVTPVHIKPALEVQKAENIQKCLDLMTSFGVPIHRDVITTEDLVKENSKTVLALCKCLRGFFDYCPESSKKLLGTTLTPRRTSQTSERLDNTREFTSPSIMRNNIEDMAIIDWVSCMTHVELKGFEGLQDGNTLCLLVNKLTGGAVPGVVLEYGLPSEKISLALMVCVEELGVCTDLQPEDIIKLTNTKKLSSLLQQLHEVFLSQKLEDNIEKQDSLKNQQNKDNTRTKPGSSWRLWDDDETRENEESRSRVNTASILTSPLKASEIFQKKPLNENLSELNFETDNSTKIDFTRNRNNEEETMSSPLETMFDPIKWQPPFKPLALKSWKREREKAKSKLEMLNEQLRMLKESYFGVICDDIKQEYFEDSDGGITNMLNTSIDSMHTDQPEKHSGKHLSESFNSFFGKPKGTSPPYRTWSMYINTDGDRYKRFSTRNEKSPINLSSLADRKLKKAKKSHEDDRRVSNTMHTRQKTSPQSQSSQTTLSRDLSNKRPLNTTSARNSDSQLVSGPLHGITALVRMSSKKANAVSDTESN